jgi:hypothetical protein
MAPVPKAPGVAPHFTRSLLFEDYGPGDLVAQRGSEWADPDTVHLMTLRFEDSLGSDNIENTIERT